MKNILSITSLLFSIFLGSLLVVSCSKEKEAQVQRLSDPDQKASCVFMTQNQEGVPVVSWVEQNAHVAPKMFFAVWNTKSGAFEDHTEIPIPGNVSIHEEGMPKIAFKGDGTMVATFESSVPEKGSEWGRGHFDYIVSTDQGKTWSAPQAVDTDPAAQPTFTGLATLTDGELAAVWLDSDADTGKRKVSFAKSLPAGGFGKPVTVATQVCECCRVAVAEDNTGEIRVAFRNVSDDNVRDIAASVSTDGGQTFSERTLAHPDTWKLEGCPHNGPALATSSDQQYLAWYSGAGDNKGVHVGIYKSGSTKPETKMLSAEGNFIQITTAGGVPVAAYSETHTENGKTYSRIVLQKIAFDGNSGQPTILSVSEKNLNFPVLRSVSDQQVVVAWRDNNQISYKAVKL